MEHEIQYSKQALKFLEKQPLQVRQRIDNAIKQIPKGDIVMDNEAALKLWDFISRVLYPDIEEAGWEAIPEAVPDEIDLQMLKEIDDDPDCRDFVPADEARKILGLA